MKVRQDTSELVVDGSDGRDRKHSLSPGSKVGSLLLIRLEGRLVDHALRGGLVEDVVVGDCHLVSSDEVGATILEVGVKFVIGVVSIFRGSLALGVVVLVIGLLKKGHVEELQQGGSEGGDGPVEPLVDGESLLELRRVDACRELLGVDRAEVSQLGGTLGNTEVIVDLEEGNVVVTARHLVEPLFLPGFLGEGKALVFVLDLAGVEECLDGSRGLADKVVVEFKFFRFHKIIFKY